MPPLQPESAGSGETTNATILNQVVGKLIDAGANGSSAVITAINSIASAFTASIIGGTTGGTANRILTAKGTTGRALQASGASVDSSGNINTNGGDLTVDDITADDISAQDGAFSATLTKGGSNLAVVTQTIGVWSGPIKYPEAETIRLILNTPFAFDITQANVITEVGTATVTVVNNGSNLTAVNASTTLNNVNLSSTVTATSYVAVTFSSVSSDCENLCLTIWGTRVLSS